MGTYTGRGVVVCISPWNFPLAIFTGQVVAGLAAGNSVICKPADQTVLIGHAAVKLLHEAGAPEAVLQFVPGKGSMIALMIFWGVSAPVLVTANELRVQLKVAMARLSAALQRSGRVA